jgi:cephalosporin-C deacetylase-like acetyl esterase
VLGASSVTVTNTLEEPGFLRCTAVLRRDGKVYRGDAAAAYEPEKIRTMTTMPPDFMGFWEQGRKQLAQVPVNPVLTRREDRCSESVDVFSISFAGIDDTRVYGFLCVPKGKEGPFPAYVTVPGAGAGPYGPSGMGWAKRGVLHLTVSVHSHDAAAMSKEEVNAAYEALNAEGLYIHHGLPDRDKFFFRRVFLGADRAISWLASRPDYDGRHMVFYGSSQGGGSALILTGLNKHITAVAANVPGFCDQAGFQAGRRGGWPGMVKGKTDEERAPYLAASRYYDAVNFARFITCPAVICAGFIDGTCSPSSVYAAYNEINAPKRMFHGVTQGHTTRMPGFQAFLQTWIPGQLGLRDPVPPTAAAEAGR